MRLKPFIPLFAIFLLAGCHSNPDVRRYDYLPALQVPEDAHPTPVKFSELDLLLPVGMTIGYESLESRLCIAPNYLMTRNELRKAIDEDYARRTFHDALEASGYDIVGSLEMDFDREDEK